MPESSEETSNSNEREHNTEKGAGDQLNMNDKTTGYEYNYVEKKHVQNNDRRAIDTKKAWYVI
jgi:sortase (surface protein transpeptidase)